MRTLILSISLIVLGFVSQSISVYAKSPIAAPKQNLSQFSAGFREIWASLDKTQNNCPDEYDYYPNGGMRIFYCHIKNFMDYKQLQQLSNIPIFLRGPHSNTQLNLHARYNFGYYNPEFVTWLVEHAIPGEKDQTFRSLTQTMYAQFVSIPARIYYMVYQELQSKPAFHIAQQQKYEDLIVNQTLPQYYRDEYYEFAGLEQAGYDGNIVSGAVLFWLRRGIDGTAAQFYQGLEKLIKTYDADFASQFLCQYASAPTSRKKCADNEYQKADQVLNQVYGDLMKKLDKNSQKKLRHAQRKWLEYRDANAGFLAEFYQGIRHNEVAHIEAKTTLTRARAEGLQGLSIQIQ
ncbi:DUF1311 domain-containing protein [Candidatus Venteria ishoeyi]|uniref:lysozyme inhibitor LprI family protein n=1 Tax=Candidatus Venteria ishoeyi TaxID=1899563 RepID=UPI0025A5F21E|nr:lysozyme inhibitor LprI family protein [Candidatus Venteria ishoeyi]MDM8545474.1 DUF1311 domain-containing protein [Candidatus Venteria ishoeyi]